MEYSTQGNGTTWNGGEETDRLLTSAARGNTKDLERLLGLHTGRLTRMIALRIDSRLSRRIDVEDVIQEVHLQAAQHLSAYLRTPDVPFYLWLRGVTAN
ncbi:MAG TPA: hypothetical protein P5307_20785, partial [Pirellulaceae bacterium]|nr:hypothetical protein [Pirellulaceae bacterium]